MLEPDTLPCLSSSGVGDARRVERTDMTDAVLMEVDNHEPQVGEKRKMDKGKGVAGDDAIDFFLNAWRLDDALRLAAG